MTTSPRLTLPYGIAPPGYRLPAAAHVGRVRLRVADLERSLAYYERVVGFRILARDATAATLGAHDAETVLLELDSEPGTRPVPRDGLLGLYHFAILLPDRAALGRFLQHLEDTGVRAGMSDHLVSEAIYLRDPDNLGIEVYADRPRVAWRQNGRELAMITEPLDRSAVIAEGRGDRWTGLPPGTVIGHVHLHVGDLAAADRFYHEALGLDRTAWSYPGALFLAAGGYHHHLGANVWLGPRPAAGPDDARLLEWELVVPQAADAAEALESIRSRGFATEPAPDGGVARDPWGTAVRVRAA